MMTALARGLYRLETDPPWVLDDPFGLLLIGPSWPDLYASVRSMFVPAALREGLLGLVTRSRYTEDLLAAGRFDQYVLLGAGLDSFAWRRPEALRRIRVFEVDHPSTQGWKLDRAAALGLPIHPAHTFVSVDFERDSLPGLLVEAGVDWSLPVFFSWLGVSMYLGDDAVVATLRAVATAAAGSEIVFTYVPSDEELDDLGRGFRAAFASVAAALGEPLAPGRPATDMERLVEKCGLRVVEHPTTEEMAARYLAGTGERPYSLERCLLARV